MRLHELTPYEGLDLVVHNEKTGHTVVLTSGGAVYNTEDTKDLRNMSVAFGLLFTSDAWRIATTAEVAEFRKREDDALLKLEWAPIPQPKPHLTPVK